MRVFLLEERATKWYAKKIKIIDDKIMLNYNFEKLKINKKIKIVQKLKTILNENNVKKIIISENLKKDKNLSNLLYSNGFSIIDGKGLQKKLINKILDKICKQNALKEQETKLSILLNGINTWGLNLIEDLSKKFKNLNVVTNNINCFKGVKDRIWEEYGIVVTLTNNKKKALSNSEIILNMDFPEELINKYILFDTSILINLEENVKVKKKRFCGKIINDYKICLKKDSDIYKALKSDVYKNYDIKDLAEVYVIGNPKELQNIIICD